MRKLLIGALVAGQVLGSGAPAFAQGFVPAQETQAGAFAGLRVHLSFGSATPEPLRAGLAFAPTVRTSTQDGRVRTRIAEGFEFGLRGREPAQFSLAGTPVNRLVQGRAGPGGRRAGISTIGWIAIGVGASLVILVAATAICASDSDCIGSE